MKKITFDFKKIKLPDLRKIRKDVLMALLSYLHILVVIPLFFSKNDEFVHYHAKQGFLLLILWILAGFSFFVPYLPWLFILVILINLIFGIIYVVLGKKKPMPILGKFAEKINI